MNSTIELAGISDVLIRKKIFIQFSVGEEGSVSKANVVIVKKGSLNENIKVEVLNIFKATHQKPGTINGEPVQVQLVLPFNSIGTFDFYSPSYILDELDKHQKAQVRDFVMNYDSTYFPPELCERQICKLLVDWAAIFRNRFVY